MKRMYYRIPRLLPDPRRSKKKMYYSLLEEKAAYFASHPRAWSRKRWYYRNHKGYWLKLKLRRLVAFLVSRKVSFLPLDLLRWLLVDFLRGKGSKHWGIYCYVANPGEGKTLSMVAHMERTVKDVGRGNIFIATNFHYVRQDMQITHWSDMVRAAKIAMDHGQYCILSMDEIHITFDKSDWKSFPPEMLSLLSFNRKYDLQFLCSSQRLDRIPSKVVGISNYVVLCRNIWGLDRLFENWYFATSEYDAKFNGKRSSANFVRTYVAGDDLYALYDTKKQIETMLVDAEAEKDKRQEAFDLLFGGGPEAGKGQD